jgi:Ca-activated chloride channel family protein
MQLYSWWALLLLLGLPPLAYLMLRAKRGAAVRFSSLGNITGHSASWRLRLRPGLVATRLLAVALLVVALARPRKGTVLQEVSTKGVAMEVVVDRSGSMRTEMDYKGRQLDRLSVVKEVLSDFIKGDGKSFKGRNGDLIGLVAFARYADTACPMVSTYGVLLQFLKATQIVTIESENATAIGDAIALAAARLKDAEQELHQRTVKLGLGGATNQKGASFKIKSKAIVLLTDGRNNAGRYSPLEAAQLAEKWGIKIYTIGIGSGQSFMTMQTPMGTYKVPTEDLDEGLLTAIAERTGGFYGRADDAAALQKIIKRIDSLEKTEVKSVQYTQYAEKFGPWTLAALAFLGFEILAGSTVFRKIP